MDKINDLLKKIELEAFEGINSPNIQIRLRSLYEYALQCVEPDKLDVVIADIIEYEKEMSLITLSFLNAYSVLTVKQTLSDFSSVAIHFAQSRGKCGVSHLVASYMLKGFLDFVDCNEQEIESIDGLDVVSETILDFNYASANSQNLSFRMRYILM